MEKVEKIKILAIGKTGQFCPSCTMSDRETSVISDYLANFFPQRSKENVRRKWAHRDKPPILDTGHL